MSPMAKPHKGLLLHVWGTPSSYFHTRILIRSVYCLGSNIRHVELEKYYRPCMVPVLCFDIGMQIGGALRLKCIIEGFDAIAMLQMKFLSFELNSAWKLQTYKLY